MLLEINTEMEQYEYNDALLELEKMIEKLDTQNVIWKNQRGRDEFTLDFRDPSGSLIGELLGRCSEYRIQIHTANERHIKMMVYHHDAPTGAYRHVFKAASCASCQAIVSQYYQIQDECYCNDCVKKVDNEA